MECSSGEKKDFLNPLYQEDNNKEIIINYKQIKLWREYFYRFEKGENEDLYRKLYNKKIIVMIKRLNKNKK